MFENVERGANLSNFDSSVINKQPDLVIRLANSPLVNTRRYVGIFAETKVVSQKKGSLTILSRGFLGLYAVIMHGQCRMGS